MQQQQDPVAGLLFRVDVMEREIVSLKQQLLLYEPVRENDLKLQNIKDTTLRIESEITSIREKVEDITEKMVLQEKESVKRSTEQHNEFLKRDAEQREEMNKIQIRALWWVVSTVIGLGLVILAGYITHFFH